MTFTLPVKDSGGRVARTPGTRVGSVDVQQFVVMRRGVVGVVGLALLVAACAPAGSPIRVGPVASITAPAPAGRMTKLTDTTTAFAVALYNQLRTSDTSTNLAFSPFSVATVLAMIEQGARGPTAEQIRTALQAGDMTPAELAASFRAVMTDLDQAARTANIELDLANAVWVQTGLRLRPGFVETLKNDFASAPQLSDFRGNPEGARQAVNAWASAHTHQRIPELLPSGLVDRATRLILANAV
jgi:serpin B